MHPHPDRRHLPEGQAHRVPDPGPVVQPLPRLRCPAHGGPWTASRTASSRRARGQGPLRAAARGARRDQAGPGFVPEVLDAPRPTTSSCSRATSSPRTSSTPGSITSARTRSTRSASARTRTSSRCTSTSEPYQTSGMPPAPVSGRAASSVALASLIAEAGVCDSWDCEAPGTWSAQLLEKCALASGPMPEGRQAVPPSVGGVPLYLPDEGSVQTSIQISCGHQMYPERCTSPFVHPLERPRMPPSSARSSRPQEGRQGVLDLEACP